LIKTKPGIIFTSKNTLTCRIFKTNMEEQVIAEKTKPPRLRCVNRQQEDPRPRIIENLIDEEHLARIVWAFVMGLDLSPLYVKIQAVEGRPGAPAIDPIILMALWLYAVIDGLSSGRRLAELCETHSAYIWLCGGVKVNHHTLSDFWTAHEDYLEKQLKVQIAALMAEGLVNLNRTAQDGIRVRASAGAASFRRKETLENCLEEAEAHLDKLRLEREENPVVVNKRQQAARERASRERHERVSEALKQLPEVEAKKKEKDRKKARVSTTDPDARVMKMGDGGFRPAYNGQFCTDTETQIIVGVDVTNSGSDQGQLTPMLEQIEVRCEQLPKEVLVDGGFVNLAEIDELTQRDIDVYAPVPKPKNETRDPHEAMPSDSEAVAAWRKRMGSDDAKEIYKQRASTAECVNAIARNRGLLQFNVRGIKKVKNVLLWFALAHNILRAAELRIAAA
jgi:transposase